MPDQTIPTRLHTIPTRVTAERFDRVARRGLASEAEFNRDDLHRGLIALVSALDSLKFAGAGKDRLLELAQLAHDTISIRDAECRKDIDEAGIYCEPIDLQDLDALLVGLA